MVAPNQPLSIQIIADINQLLTDLDGANNSFTRMEVLLEAVSQRLAVLGGMNVFQNVSQDFADVTQKINALGENSRAIQAMMQEEQRATGESLDYVTEAMIRQNDANRTHNAIWRQLVADIANGRSALSMTSQEVAILGEGLRETFSTKEITLAKKELQNYQKVLDSFRQNAPETWGTFNQMIQQTTQNIVGSKTAVKKLEETITSMRASGATLREIEHAMKMANEQFGRLIAPGLLAAAFKNVADKEREADRALKEYLNTISRTGQAWGDQPIKGFQQQLQQLFGSFSGLNSVSQIFFGTTLGHLGVQAFRSIKNIIAETVTNGQEWSRTIFNMGLAVRALQRTGINITLAEMNEQVEVLSEKFNFFTTRELQEGISQIALLTRNVGLSKDEMFQLSEATATLAIITGKDFGEQGLLVARSIASGYTEALQRAGIAANRLAIQHKAMTMGINKSFLQMTEQERAAVTLALVLDQVAALSDDATKFQETLAGKMQLANVMIQKQKDIIGKEWLPIAIAWQQATVKMYKVLSWFVNKVVEGFLGIAQVVGAVAVVFWAMRDNLEGVLASGGIQKLFRQAMEDMHKSLEEYWFDPEQLDVPDDEFNMFPPDFSAEEAVDETKSKFDSMVEKFDDIITDYVRKLEDLFLSLKRKEADIATKYERREFDLNVGFQADKEQLDRDYISKVSQAYQKHRVEEINAEEKFQEKMLQLREKFIFDLEDAIRERDAKAVLRLIRDYNLRSTQMNREEELARIQRDRDFQLELAQMAQQRAIRLQEMEIEHEMKLAQMALDKQRELDDLQLWYDRERADAETARDRRLADLRESLDAELLQYFLHGQALIDWAATTVNTVNEIFSHMVTFGNPFINPSQPRYGEGTRYNRQQGVIPFRGGRAEGGTDIVKKPTLILAGEKGAEVHSFTPLNRVGRDENKVFGGRLPSSGSSDGNATILVQLEPGLKAEIAGMAMDGVGEIMIETLRK